MIHIKDQLELWPLAQEAKRRASTTMPSLSFQGAEQVKIKRKEFRIARGNSSDFDTVELIVSGGERSMEFVLFTTPGGLKNLEATE